jgi:hypothetical protein
MNKTRFKAVEAVLIDLNTLNLEDMLYTQVQVALRKNKSNVESIQSDEQDAYDNMSESAQESERGAAIEENLEQLSSAVDALEFAIGISDEEGWQEDIEGNIQEAIEALENLE